MVLVVRLLPRRRHRPARRVEVGALPLSMASTGRGIYGGYFGAAQGVMLIAILGIFLPDDLQRLNGLKNVLARPHQRDGRGCCSSSSAPIAWPVTILLAIGSSAGGVLGANLGRRLSPGVLRVAIIVIGTVVAVRLLVG